MRSLWGIGFWNIESLLWRNFHIPEDHILEPFVQDDSKEPFGI
jgi:hypothetical protein